MTAPRPPAPGFPPGSLAVYALTGAGADLARTLARGLQAAVFLPAALAREGETPFEALPVLVAGTFARFAGHLFVTAAGIAVRAIAPHLEDKTRDPAVVVLDQEGRFAVSLLSGHLGGANDLARLAAALTGGRAVLTTATDTAGFSAPDLLARRRGLTVENPEMIREVNAALLRGEEVQVFDPEGWLGLTGTEPGYRLLARMVDHRPDRPGVWTDFQEGTGPPGVLLLRPPCLHLGVGCRRGVPAREILTAVRSLFFGNGLALASLASLGSAEIKRDEPGLLEAAAELGLAPRFLSLDQLGRIPVPHPSATVAKHIGVPSVCEAAALLMSAGGSLLIPKTKTGTVTLALARSWP